VLLIAGVVAAYLVGTFPSAQLVARSFGAEDPTKIGSGNPGASNVYRSAGKRAGVLVGLVDVLKGAIPVGVALLVAGRPEAHAVWVAAVCGHIFPVTRGFRGGKGVATAGGGGMVLSPVLAVMLTVAFFAIVRFGRIAALGSLAVALAYPALVWVVGRESWEVLTSLGLACLVIARHRGNLERLLRRSEATV